ncbi:cyclohexadienyl dehydratase [Sinobacterium caligoides]|uniref:Cyclohexadienyl dehydratase n=1 Tax=Sinobacterium caligoides TaxID=933926 RepID=A0A3N2DN50_9GAMM|nr:transporter substrate-binding domain-containing protein [Sinobacterium caligoides]ROS01233.1 cyclohexadienyl dehydratase [Sinobacterium caligoides]
MRKNLAIAMIAFGLVGALPVKAEVLTVGTTGDYKPLTWYNAESDQYTGQSVALVKAFAEEYGYELKIVRTTWPNLSADLAEGKFQLAVGGITITEQRQKTFIFSDPLRVFGKTPLVRCGEEKKFSQLSQIDRPGITVVENPGGTNEKLARDIIHHAKLVVVEDNHQPFEYLLNHQADVMFTDSIEATYKQNQQSGLCAAAPNWLLKKGEKAFMFRDDETELRGQFNRWLNSYKKKK